MCYFAFIFSSSVLDVLVWLPPKRFETGWGRSGRVNINMQSWFVDGGGGSGINGAHDGGKVIDNLLCPLSLFAITGTYLVCCMYCIVYDKNYNKAFETEGFTVRSLMSHGIKCHNLWALSLETGISEAL